MAQGPVCIRRTNTIEEAQIIIAWLEEQHIKATVVDPSSTGAMAFGVTDPEGIEIYVADAETADRAKAALAEHDGRHTRTLDDSTPEPMIDLVCEECSQVNSFPRDQAGTVQECSDCGTYLDVPSDTE